MRFFLKQSYDISVLRYIINTRIIVEALTIIRVAILTVIHSLKHLSFYRVLCCAKNTRSYIIIL